MLKESNGDDEEESTRVNVMWEDMKVCCLFLIFRGCITVNPDFQARGHVLFQSAAAMTTVYTAFTAAVDSISVQGENEEEKE